MTLEEKLWKTFNKALGKYQLIDEGDRILVGLSGGKDSLLLLEFLARRSKVRVPHFTVEALHVRMENIHYETDTSYLQSFCEQLSVPLHIVTTRFADQPQSANSTQFKEKPPCFLCSWQRRANLRYDLDSQGLSGSNSRNPTSWPAICDYGFDFEFSIIRPLCLCCEDDIRLYAEAHHYEKQVKRCPYEHDTNRTTARDLFDHMQKMNPEARYCLWTALESEGKLIEY